MSMCSLGQLKICDSEAIYVKWVMIMMIIIIIIIIINVATLRTCECDTSATAEMREQM